ncbi:hypothetical protein M0R36_10600 [bacterium]|jgi:hypothetical protein|nr:hypothetical protein [bacterium]
MKNWLKFMWGIITSDLPFLCKLYGLTYGQLLYLAAKGNAEDMNNREDNKI